MSDHYYPYTAAPQGYGAGLPAAGAAPGHAQGQGQGPGPGQAQGQAQGLYASAHQGYAPYPGAYASAYPGAYPAQYQAQHPAQYQATPFLNFSNDRFVKGLLIGAAAAYLLTNESVQRTAIKGVVKLWSTLQGGVEEIKERFQDAEAELRAGEPAPKA